MRFLLVVLQAARLRCASRVVVRLASLCQGYSVFWEELDQAVVGMGFDSLYSPLARRVTDEVRAVGEVRFRWNCFLGKKD